MNDECESRCELKNISNKMMKASKLVESILFQSKKERQNDKNVVE